MKIFSSPPPNSSTSALSHECIFCKWITRIHHLLFRILMFYPLCDMWLPGPDAMSLYSDDGSYIYSTPWVQNFAVLHTLQYMSGSILIVSVNIMIRNHAHIHPHMFFCFTHSAIFECQFSDNMSTHSDNGQHTYSPPYVQNFVVLPIVQQLSVSVLMQWVYFLIMDHTNIHHHMFRF